MYPTKLTTVLMGAAVVFATACSVHHPPVAPRDVLASGLKATGAMEVPAATYNIDPVHSSIAFDITHLGVSVTHGRFNEFSGTIVENGGDLTNSSVEFTAKVASIDTGVPPRDEHLRNPDFFNIEEFPELTFKSTKVERTGDRYAVTGDLTMKGVSRSITIPFRHFGPYKLEGFGDMPPCIGVVADPVVILRGDFGLGDTAPLPDGTMGVSNEVVVTISLEAGKAE